MIKKRDALHPLVLTNLTYLIPIYGTIDSEYWLPSIIYSIAMITSMVHHVYKENHPFWSPLDELTAHAFFLTNLTVWIYRGVKVVPFIFSIYSLGIFYLSSLSCLQQWYSILHCAWHLATAIGTYFLYID